MIVDRELGRTRKDWLPRRLGGGKGDSRRDRNDEDLTRKLKLELEQEERALPKGQKLEKLQEPELVALKNEGAEDAQMSEKPLADSENESGERKKPERSRSRSRERDHSSRHYDDRYSRKHSRKHHRDDHSHDRHYRYNSHIEKRESYRSDRGDRNRREKDSYYPTKLVDEARVKRQKESGNESDEREPGEL